MNRSSSGSKRVMGSGWRQGGGRISPRGAEIGPHEPVAIQVVEGEPIHIDPLTAPSRDSVGTQGPKDQQEKPDEQVERAVVNRFHLAGAQENGLPIVSRNLAVAQRPFQSLHERIPVTVLPK